MLKARWLLPLWFLIVYLLPLPERPLWTPDETRYAEISREMIQSGDWVVPHLLGLDYFEKPVAGYWANSLSQLLLGETNLAVRFASVLSTALSGLLLYFFALQLWGHHRKAMAATLIYLSCLLVYGIGSYSVLDPMLTLWLNGAMVAAFFASKVTSTRGKIGYYLLLGFCCGMGVLTKGFIALAAPVVAIVPFMLLNRRMLELCTFGWLALLTAIVTLLPWGLLVHLRAPDYWHYFFWVEHVQRFAGANAQHSAPFWYYLPCLLLGLIPWLGLLPDTLKGLWQRRNQWLAEENTALYLLLWVIMPLLLFSIAKGKLPTYILPCFAPLALLLTDNLFRDLGQKQYGGLRLNAIINLLLGLVALLAILLLGNGWMGKTPLYGEHESARLLLAAFCFSFWGLLGWFILQKPQRRWSLSPLCPLVLVLIYPAALPLSVVNSKLPDAFLTLNHEPLAASRFIFSTDTGLAVSMGWQLKRTDIMLLGTEGELEYGLQKRPAGERMIPRESFADWLATARTKGQVAVLTKLESDQQPAGWPAATQTIRANRLLLLIYGQQP